MKPWYRAKRGPNKKKYFISDIIKISRKSEKLSIPFQKLFNCVRQNIQLRDHKDSTSTIHKWEESNPTNSGNLAEFIQHRIEREDKNLENYLQNTK